MNIQDGEFRENGDHFFSRQNTVVYNLQLLKIQGSCGVAARSSECLRDKHRLPGRVCTDFGPDLNYWRPIASPSAPWGPVAVDRWPPFHAKRPLRQAHIVPARARPITGLAPSGELRAGPGFSPAFYCPKWTPKWRWSSLLPCITCLISDQCESGVGENCSLRPIRRIAKNSYSAPTGDQRKPRCQQLYHMQWRLKYW